METPVIYAQQAAIADNGSWKQTVLYGSIGLVSACAAFYFGRKIYREYVAKHEEGKTMDDGSAASYAKGIKMAFDNDGWPGANETALRTVIRQIPSKQVYEQVEESFERLYQQPLAREMSDELSIDEYNEMLQIVAGKPLKVFKGVAPVLNYPAWARRLKSAFNTTIAFIPFPDKEAITAVFLDIPTQSAFVEMAKSYNKLYGKNVIEELKYQLWGWNEYDDMMRLVIRKPKS